MKNTVIVPNFLHPLKVRIFITSRIIDLNQHRLYTMALEQTKSVHIQLTVFIMDIINTSSSCSSFHFHQLPLTVILLLISCHNKIVRKHLSQSWVIGREEGDDWIYMTDKLLLWDGQVFTVRFLPTNIFYHDTRILMILFPKSKIKQKDEMEKVMNIQYVFP